MMVNNKNRWSDCRLQHSTGRMKAAEQSSNKAPDLEIRIFTFRRMSPNEDRLLVLIVDLHRSVSRHVCLVVVDPWGP